MCNLNKELERIFKMSGITKIIKIREESFN